MIKVATELSFFIGIVWEDFVLKIWNLSFIINRSKEDGNALYRGIYRGHKLSEHVTKVLKHILSTINR